MSLERLLLTMTAWLFTAVAGHKKKAAKKPIKKKTVKTVRPPTKKHARPKKPLGRGKVKPAARPSPAKKSARDKTTKRGRVKPPVQPAVAKPAPAEPLPKPVPPTGRAILLAPENQKFSDSLHPTFRWLSVGGATRYETAWSEDSHFTQSHQVISIATEATVPVEKPLRLGGTYYWRVRGGNESGWGPWSATSSFRVLEEAE